MMKKHYKILFGSLLIALLLTGCGIPSVHPLYEPDDLIIQKELSGKWQKSKGGTTYRVYNFREFKDHKTLRDSLDIKEDDEFLKGFEERNLEKLYLIFNPDIGSENTELYLGGLVKISNNYYLDLYKYEPFKDVFYYPVHIFVRLEIENDKVVMHQFREQWIKDLIKNRQIRIKHEVSFDNFLLTASTKELKTFVRKYGSDPDAYREDSDTYFKIDSDESTE